MYWYVANAHNVFGKQSVSLFLDSLCDLFICGMRLSMAPFVAKRWQRPAMFFCGGSMPLCLCLLRARPHTDAGSARKAPRGWLVAACFRPTNVFLEFCRQGVEYPLGLIAGMCCSKFGRDAADGGQDRHFIFLPRWPGIPGDLRGCAIRWVRGSMKFLASGNGSCCFASVPTMD